MAHRIRRPIRFQGSTGAVGFDILTEIRVLLPDAVRDPDLDFRVRDGNQQFGDPLGVRVQAGRRIAFADMDDWLPLRRRGARRIAGSKLVC